MSNYMDVYCKDCHEYSKSDINRGDHIIQDVYNVVDLIAEILYKVTTDYLEFSIMAHGPEIIYFMVEHKDHELWICSEYGINHETSRKLVKT